MFQRIRGAIDARIAEEQARQRASQETLSRSNSDARKSNTSSPSQRANRARQDSTVVPTRGPDPAEFDGETIVGGDEPTSETGGLSQTSDKSVSGSSAQVKEDSTSMLPKDGNTSELPTDIRVKLRRLDKLESRYQELLKAYRTAHARVLTIEPFETALRENTPLTSITDPHAMTEYLSQISLKGDLVVEELKRVSSERDDFQKKLDIAENSANEAWNEIAGLKLKKSTERARAQAEGVEPQENKSISDLSSADQSKDENVQEISQKAPTPSMTSIATSIPGLSLFSPRTKTVSSPPPAEENLEFFSFDVEVPRLESELIARQNEITDLKIQVKTLANDLAVARESTEGMVHSLESATRELSALRENKDREEEKSAAQQSAFKKNVALLESKLEIVSSELEGSKSEMEHLRAQLKDKENEFNQVKLHMDSHEQNKDGDLLNDKRLGILQGVVGNLKSQLKNTEDTVSSLKSELLNCEKETASLRTVVNFVDSGLEGNTAWILARDQLSKGESADFTDVKESIGSLDCTKVTTNAQHLPGGIGSSRKRKNKRKKAAKLDLEPDSPHEDMNNVPISPNIDSLKEFEVKLQALEIEIKEKEVVIDRLHSRLKGEESLREEIETLKDEVVTLGQDHVEAKDKIKQLTVEKSTFEQRTKVFETELTILRDNSTESSEVEKAYKDLSLEYEGLKSKAKTLETDLIAAQQLAATRFKDLTDLRETLQNIQPELRALRAESIELKSAKEALRSREMQISDLERKQEDLLAQWKNMKSSMEEKDSEVKSLRQRVSQEANARLKAEKSLEVGQADLRYSEGKKQEAVETNEKTLRDLSKAEADLQASQTKLHEVESQAAQLDRDVERLREEIKLKTAQYSSAQSLMSSMRDQASEMAMQVKEATEKCEGLEEEVSDAHRLLSERSREGETMRRLLSDIEMKADIKVRDYKERLEATIQERDRAEDEANSANRRRAREIEELKTKARDAEKTLRRVEEDKEEIELAQKEWKRRRNELESQLEISTQELAEIKDAMTQLRNALDESERQARDLEKDKAALRRSVEESSQRMEKLKRTNKALASDLKASQQPNKHGIDSINRSPRSSLDSSRQRSVVSPPPPATPRNVSISRKDMSPSSIDYVYLKNVLLQFLEQKDKNHQKQLIPVLGMLLHFDPADEQRWMSAITSR